MQENTLSVGGVFGQAWAVFKDNISYVYYLLVPSFFFSLLGVIILVVSSQNMQAGSEAFLAGILPSLIFSVLAMIAGVLGTISLLFFLRSNKKDTWKSWTEYFRLLPKYILVCILQGLMILAGLILFVIPGIYLALRYAFVSYRTLEHPTESIRNLFAAEARATEGNRLTIFCIGLALVGIVLVYGVVFSLLLFELLGVGEEGSKIFDVLFEILLTPFFSLVSIITYIKLTEKKGAEESTSGMVKEETVPSETLESTPVAEPAL